MRRPIHRAIALALLACAASAPDGGALAQAPSFTLGANFNGSSINQSGFIPPDTMGAIGPSDYVELINGRFARYGKTGVQQEARSLDSFWNTALAAGGGGSVQSFSFDPRVMYDRHSGRWFATAVDSLRSTPSGRLPPVDHQRDPRRRHDGKRSLGGQLAGVPVRCRSDRPALGRLPDTRHQR
ncbi:MAG: hypothetical protein FJ309_16055 [Planctomycetes bacterium]|nr:hypothetical protein [Planctomycetota bacterium]